MDIASDLDFEKKAKAIIAGLFTSRPLLMALVSVFFAAHATLWGFLLAQPEAIRFFIDPRFLSNFYTEFGLALVAAGILANLFLFATGVCSIWLPARFQKRLSVRKLKRSILQPSILSRLTIVVLSFPFGYLGGRVDDLFVAFYLVFVAAYSRFAFFDFRLSLAGLRTRRAKQRTAKALTFINSLKSSRFPILSAILNLPKLFLLGLRLKWDVFEQRVLIPKLIKSLQRDVRHRKLSTKFIPILMLSMVGTIFAYAGYLKAEEISDNIVDVSTVSGKSYSGSIVAATSQLVFLRETTSSSVLIFPIGKIELITENEVRNE